MGTLCRDFRQHEEEERTKPGARTRYLNMPKVEMADSMCSGYRKSVLLQATPGWRLPQDHKAAHLTRGKAHRESPGRTVRKPGLLNNVWNHMETYGNVRKRMETCEIEWKRTVTY